MAKSQRKTGKPKALELEEEETERPSPEETLDGFLKGMFGSSIEELKDGELPSLTFLKEHFKTKSASIRFLVSKGFKRTIIAKHLGVKYQHVRNVATSTLKRGPNEDWNLSGGISPGIKPKDKP